MSSRPCHIVLLSAFCAYMAPAFAHDGRPLYIELTEVAAQVYQLQWKCPFALPPGNSPIIAFPTTCMAENRAGDHRDRDGMTGRITYGCDRALARHAITITYPYANPSISSLIRYTTLSGEQHTALLGPQQTAWIVPPSETFTSAAHQYLLFGMRHIWLGFDHLLFLLCLLCVARSLRAILITVTGFTLAHSITLVLVALDKVKVPSPPLEVAIALSIVFMATELVRGPGRSLTWRHPIAVSSSFGLLHGAGFASALREIGLPQSQVATGLLFFNVGVELGQLAVILAVLTLVAGLRSVAVGKSVLATRAAELRIAIGYVVGIQAALWFLERSRELF